MSSSELGIRPRKTILSFISTFMWCQTSSCGWDYTQVKIFFDRFQNILSCTKFEFRTLPENSSRKNNLLGT